MAIDKFDQFPVGSPHEFLLEVFNTSGTKANLDAAPTYEIVDASGGTVASGTASTNGNSGEYTFETLATAVDFWTLNWSGDLGGTAVTYTTFAEPVGNVLFSEQEFRAFNDDQFSSTSRYSDDAIETARHVVTDQLERWTGRSWIPRYVRLELPGSGDVELSLDRGYARTFQGYGMYRPGRLQDIDGVLSVTVGGTSVSTSSVTVVGSHLHKPTTWTSPSTNDPLNVVVEYSYGQQYNVDGVDRIAMLLAADRLRETALSSRATTWSDELGTYRFETPGRAGNVSTIPEVNEWVKAHRSPLLSV